MKPKRAKPKGCEPVYFVHIAGEQAKRLQALARRWGVDPTEALRRVLDQAYVGRGAMVALEAGFIFLEHLGQKKPEEKKP